VYLKRSLAPKCQSLSLSLSALCCSAALLSLFTFFFPRKFWITNSKRERHNQKTKKNIYYVYDDDDVSSVHADDVDDVLQKTEKDYCDDVRIVVQ